MNTVTKVIKNEIGLLKLAEELGHTLPVRSFDATWKE
jgi:hypothetical protein